jgi:hypothetical protein
MISAFVCAEIGSPPSCANILCARDECPSRQSRLELPPHDRRVQCRSNFPVSQFLSWNHREIAFEATVSSFISSGDQPCGAGSFARQPLRRASSSWTPAVRCDKVWRKECPLYHIDSYHINDYHWRLSTTLPTAHPAKTTFQKSNPRLSRRLGEVRSPGAALLPAVASSICLACSQNSKPICDASANLKALPRPRRQASTSGGPRHRRCTGCVNEGAGAWVASEIAGGRTLHPSKPPLRPSAVATEMGQEPPPALQRKIGDHRAGWTGIRWALCNQNGTLTHGRVD